MSLKFLTRRRDRDRPNTTTTHSKSASISRSPASTDVSLPSTDSFFRKGYATEVPSEVQIISWNPKDLPSSGREVHIRSRAEDAPPSTATPVYHAFTTRPSSASLTFKEASTSNSSDAVYSGRNDTSGRTFFGARDLPTHRRHESKSSPRARSKTPRGQDRKVALSLSDELASVSLQPTQASDTPRSEHVEELDASSGAFTNLDQENATISSFPARLAPKARRAKSRSEHSHDAGRMAIHGDVDVDDLSTPSFAGTSSSLPSTSRAPFSSFQRNTSVQSFSSFISIGGAEDASANEGEATASSRGFLSRLPSTRRRSRRNKNASAGDAQSSASGDSDGHNGSRTRSASVNFMAPRFLRSREEAPTRNVKPGRAAAPPSAWRPDMAAAAPMGDTYGLSAGGGGGASSAYSSDNEMSVGPESSSGHGAESSDGRNFFQRHVRRGSSGDASVSATTHDSSSHHHHLLHPSLNIFGRTAGDASSKRTSVHSNKSGALPGHPVLHFEPASPAIDSPQVSGLPLPLPSPTTASPGGSIFTAQLFKRLGPPPVGLPPTSFEDRVELIQNYILNQACPSHPSSSFSASAGNDLSSILMSSSESSDRLLHRSSLPPTPRHATSPLTATTSSKTIRAASHYDLATLQDDFDKLECLAEREMRKLIHYDPKKGLSTADMEAFESLRLEEAFTEARRRCGMDRSRVHFEMKNVVTAVGGDEARLEASRSAGLGLALGVMREADERVGGVGGEMSLTPAPRRRRGFGGPTRRPITAPVESPAEQHSFLPNEGESAMPSQTELFTPQSFSSKPPHRPTSSNNSSRTTLRSPPLFGHPLPLSGSRTASQDTQATDEGMVAAEDSELGKWGGVVGKASVGL